jgi:hypothetical protein
VTFFAFGRIDSAARLRWLLDPLQPGAITDGTVSFGQNFTRFFHYDQLKQEKIEFICAKIAANWRSATTLPFLT